MCQVWDLLQPQESGAPLYFSPVAGPILCKLTQHIALNLDEFWSLVTSAMSVKASFTLRKDEFPSCAHVCIQCKCSFRTSLETAPTHRGVMTFFEIGSDIVKHVYNDKVSITDWSFFTLQNIVVSNDREAAAQLCGSILGYILAMTLMSTSNTILLGFVSPSLIDVDATERTLKVLENARLLALRCPWRAQSVPWSDKREIQFCNLIRNKSKFPDIPKGLCAIYQRELYHVRARVETTKLFALERRQWFTGFGLTEDLNSAGPILIHVCQNALISHRLCVKLDQDKISFGSSSCEAAKTMNHGFVQLGNASMLPLHCEILRSNGGTLSLEIPHANSMTWISSCLARSLSSLCVWNLHARVLGSAVSVK
mmetsp:Transcript_12273/g.39360  ORF Transcript_12273/g.39360 Transcript_12273/m.39360 type:complete len:368 (-) Transcript_12273:1576-2679(-)